MKIGQSGSNISGTDSPESLKKTGKAKHAKPGDKSNATDGAKSAAAADGASADISAKGKEFANAKSVATSAPDVRDEKIAELKRRIAAGGYEIKADAIADKMVDEHLAMG